MGHDFRRHSERKALATLMSICINEQQCKTIRLYSLVWRKDLYRGKTTNNLFIVRLRLIDAKMISDFD